MSFYTVIIFLVMFASSLIFATDEQKDELASTFPHVQVFPETSQGSLGCYEFLNPKERFKQYRNALGGGKYSEEQELLIAKNLVSLMKSLDFNRLLISEKLGLTSDVLSWMESSLRYYGKLQQKNALEAVEYALTLLSSDEAQEDSKNCRCLQICTMMIIRRWNVKTGVRLSDGFSEEFLFAVCRQRDGENIIAFAEDLINYGLVPENLKTIDSICKKVLNSLDVFFPRPT